LKQCTYLLLAGLFSLTLLNSNAQKQLFNPALQKQARVTQPPKRSCATDEVMQRLFETNPQARANYLRNQQMLDEKIRQIIGNPQARENRIQADIVIPVVVHILNASPSQVTNAIVQRQIDTLNFYYGGSPFNQDSLRVYTPFRTTYGRTQIRFCLAQRTPADLPTNGISRTTTSTTFTRSGAEPFTVVPAWNNQKYLNIWVVTFTDQTLGFAYLPGSPNPGAGFVCDYRAFGSGGAYLYPDFDQGKTAVHEIGHYFNLNHTFGPGNGTSNPSCTDDGCSDTPLTAEAVFGCPTAIPVTNTCSPAAPGVMWQNHMDYADDACMLLFTVQQCLRMEIALNNSPDRTPLITSNGCVAPPPAPGNDAGISTIITPADGSSLACSSISPLVTIKNMGSNTLTSATINVRLDGSLVTTQNWTGNLAQGSTVNITLAPLSIPTDGSYILKIHTTLPNGLVDVDPANDTATSEFTKIAPVDLPVTHNFEDEFLPEGWSLSNPDADNTWVWATPGAGGTGTGAAAIDNFSGDGSNIGHIDDINTTVINTSGLLANDSLLVTFDLAHKNYPGQNDGLQVLASDDCGGTYTVIWEKVGEALATAGSSTAPYSIPVPADWINQRAAIGQNLFGGGEVQFAFRSISDWGNLVWIDNINVDVKPRKDMQVTAIVRPNLTECAPPFAPSITVKNSGGETVTGFKTGYILNGGAPFIQSHNISLALGASATITFPNINPPSGNNIIKLFVADPLTASPGPDGTPANDTLTRSFTVPVIVTNVVEGFEGTAFPPANWFRINPNNDTTWRRTTPGKTSNFSAFVNNFEYATNVYLFDYLQAPPVNTAGADSLIITFDVAHKVYVYQDGSTSVDNLSVLIARNCATTFSTVYSKTGEDLATAGSAGTDAYVNPAQSDWRRERVAINLITTPANNVIVQFRNADAYGNNIYIDNINIAPVFKRDIEILSVSPDVACSPNYTPVATIHNRGTQTVTAFDVSYTIGSGAAVTTNVTGVSLAPGATTTVTLTAGTLVTGANSIQVYTSSPVTASGTGDQYLLNDTIRKTSYVASTVQSPIVETFEGSFLPAGWALSNPDNDLTWQKASTGKGSTGSAYLRNFVYFSNGQKDDLYTPVLDFTGVDSVKVSFDLSAATRDISTAAVPMDTLEVLVTTDCGNTFTSVYKKWGDALQTVDIANYAQTTEYIPLSPHLWRTENIDLTSYAPNGPVQLVFRNTTNNQNNVYIDNVNLSTRILPAKLKADGFIALPNPFSEQFDLWFVQAPSDLRYITLLNSSGQLIWKKEFNGSISNVININLAGKAAGMYIINLGYSDKSKDKQVRVLKSN
jgi:archaellum component FlaF (FlaF/FlaG flagellin family)